MIPNYIRLLIILHSSRTNGEGSCKSARRCWFIHGTISNERFLFVFRFAN
jgi:hypothetical protein